MSVIVTGHVYRDENCEVLVPTPLGPFENRADAALYMVSLSPLWGSWLVQPLWTPEPIRREQP